MYLSPESIEDATNFKCESMRKSLLCPNDGLCLNQFTRTQGPVFIKELRAKFWKEGGSTSTRKAALRESLSSFLVVDENRRKQLHFRINGTAVCKSFFKVLMSQLAPYSLYYSLRRVFRQRCLMQQLHLSLNLKPMLVLRPSGSR
jgi:hypothetical protein